MGFGVCFGFIRPCDPWHLPRLSSHPFLRPLSSPSWSSRLLGHQRPGSFVTRLPRRRWSNSGPSAMRSFFMISTPERFDPILPDAKSPRAPPLDAVVARHCREVVRGRRPPGRSSERWAMPPAILKGWSDRVLRQGRPMVCPEASSACSAGSGRGATTSNTPREDELRLFAPPGEPLEDLHLQFLGVEIFPPQLRVDHISTPEQTPQWLAEVRRTIAQRFSTAA